MVFLHAFTTSNLQFVNHYKVFFLWKINAESFWKWFIAVPIQSRWVMIVVVVVMFAKPTNVFAPDGGSRLAGTNSEPEFILSISARWTGKESSVFPATPLPLPSPSSSSTAAYVPSRRRRLPRASLPRERRMGRHLVPPAVILHVVVFV